MSEQVAVKEHPIFFSGPMVRAILEGRKTQTRRVVVPQPTGYGLKWIEHDGFSAWQDDGVMLDEYPPCQRLCRYGEPGHRLWVREKWSGNGDDAVWYAADANYPSSVIKKWKPSIYMPRAASRITLEVLTVKVTQLKHITAEECLKEGIGEPGDTRLEVWSKFAKLWDAINAKRGYGWEANPWVWAIEFKRVLP